MYICEYLVCMMQGIEAYITCQTLPLLNRKKDNKTIICKRFLEKNFEYNLFLHFFLILHDI